MDENDRRRFNNDENDYYTNNSRRVPTPQSPRAYGNVPQGGVRRDYGDRSLPLQNSPYGGRVIPQQQQGGTNVGARYDRAVPQGAQSGYGFNPAQGGNYGRTVPPQAQNYAPQGGYAGRPQGGYDQSAPGYAPQQNAYDGQRQGGYAAPQGGYGQQGAPRQYEGQYADERDFSYDNVQAQPVETKKKRGLFGFGKQKKEEFDPGNMGNVIITEPRTYDDVRVIIDGLRKRQAIIIDLSKVSDKDSQRILDFLSGAIYALGGAQQRINDHMFLFTPEGVMIQGPASLRNKYR